MVLGAGVRGLDQLAQLLTGEPVSARKFPTGQLSNLGPLDGSDRHHSPARLFIAPVSAAVPLDGVLSLRWLL